MPQNKICDGDEFTFGTDTDDFREVLAKYEDYGGLFVNWLEYGHSQRLHRPQELCIEAFTQRAPEDTWQHASGKSIVKPRELLRPYAPASKSDKLGYSFLSPHLFKTNKPTVHTDFTPVSYRQWWCSEHACHDVARCNHYRFRSREDWLAKNQRGNCNDGDHPVNLYAEAHWESWGNWTLTDTAALRFAERIKAVLKR